MTDRTGGRNPLLPLEYHLPDPEAHVMPNGRLYLYGSSDRTEEAYCSTEYRVASTSDMSSWTVHGVSFRSEQAEWAANSASRGRSFLDGVNSYEELPDYVSKMLPADAESVPFKQFAAAVREVTRRKQPAEPLLYAPDAIEKDGTYYLYMCLSDGSEGVAIAERPEGPFGDPTRLPVTGIDPAVFIDDDGQAYYYWGQFSANGARLNPDMRTLDEASIVTGLLTEQDHRFHEGSSVRRRGDTYYFVFADTSRGKPTCLGYATSRNPLGPFVYRGIIIDNDGCDPKAWNNHGSIEEFNGQWYVFYHRNSRNVSSMRRVCAEPIFFADDGSIAEVKMTSQGPGTPFQEGELIPAHTACGLSGGAYLAPSGSSEALVNIRDGDTAIFRYLHAARPLRSAHFHAEGTGRFDILCNGILTGTADVGLGQAAVEIPVGTHEVELVFRRPRDCTFGGIAFD